MRTCASSRVKRKSFGRKSGLHIFLLISGGHIGGPKRYTKGVLNVSANNSETVGHKDLNLGQIVFYNISCSWHLPLDGFQCIFLLRDSETIYTFFRLACKNVSSCKMQRECTSWQISFWGHSCSVVKIFFTVHIICRNVVFCKELVGSAVVCNISCRWCYLVQYW